MSDTQNLEKIHADLAGSTDGLALAAAIIARLQAEQAQMIPPHQHTSEIVAISQLVLEADEAAAQTANNLRAVQQQADKLRLDCAQANAVSLGILNDFMRQFKEDRDTVERKIKQVPSWLRPARLIRTIRSRLRNRQVRALRQSSFFDEKWYGTQYASQIPKDTMPAFYYLDTGHSKGQAPSLVFLNITQTGEAE